MVRIHSPTQEPPLNTSAVKVGIRVRPLDGDEAIPEFLAIADKTIGVVQETESSHSSKALVNEHTFQFDAVLGPQSTQTDVFDFVKPGIQHALDGYNTLFIGYGQSGSGKTYTIGTDAGSGIIQQCSSVLFPGKYDATFFEIYDDKIYDIIQTGASKSLKRNSPSSTSSRNGFTVDGLASRLVESPEQLQTLVQQCAGNRRKSATALNDNSSRSHAILILETEENSHIVFTDLAGTERQRHSLSEGTQLTEARSINRSLSALVRVLGQLACNSTHVSFRDNILTKTLESYLSGQAHVYLIGCISSDAQNVGETLNTLRYTSSARGIALSPSRSYRPSPNTPENTGTGTGESVYPNSTRAHTEFMEILACDSIANMPDSLNFSKNSAFSNTQAFQNLPDVKLLKNRTESNGDGDDSSEFLPLFSWKPTQEELEYMKTLDEHLEVIRQDPKVWNSIQKRKYGKRLHYFCPTSTNLTWDMPTLDLNAQVPTEIEFYEVLKCKYFACFAAATDSPCSDDVVYNVYHQPTLPRWAIEALKTAPYLLLLFSSGYYIG